MELAIAVAVGLVVGIGIWFPYKHVLNMALKKKREATSILLELSLSEQEHMEQTQNAPPSYKWQKHGWQQIQQVQPTIAPNTIWSGNNYTWQDSTNLSGKSSTDAGTS